MVVLTSFAPPTSGIKHQQPSTTVHLNNKELGKGTLFITESNVSWVDSATGEGFSLQYPHISLHAVSRDLQAYPQECLYIMLDTQIEQPEHPDHSDSEEDNSSVDMTEMRFVPDDKGMLDAMFHAMSECQALHPDPQDSFSDDLFEDADDEEGEYHVGSGDPSTFSRNAANTGAVSNGNGDDEPMEMDAGQFEDAD